MNDKFRQDISRLTNKIGKGRNRTFAEVVDLSPEGVAKWRKEMGFDNETPGDEGSEPKQAKRSH